MPFDFNKVKAVKTEAKIIDPIKLFSSLKRESEFGQLWYSQGEALNEWHKYRIESDLAIVLGTGAGKTLIGLLVSKSLVNETQGKVLYVCSSNQLIEQTIEKANSYGIEVASYFKGHFENEDAFESGNVPCLTNYQAVFNGHSRFRNADIDAIIFDDAHTAEHVLRDQFTVTIHRSDYEELYDRIHGLFKPYHEKANLLATYSGLLDRDPAHLILIPPFEIIENRTELTRILVNSGLEKNLNTKFSWKYLKDKIHLCAFNMTASHISITPPFIPTGTLDYFEKSKRRVYLSASLSTPDSFARTFGVTPRIIAPESFPHKHERALIFSSMVSNKVDSEFELVKEIVSNQKTLILCPSFHGAEKWSEVAEILSTDNISQRLINFKESEEPTSIVLTARFDGIDFPGDTCRVMVFDDLPVGAGFFERYMWEVARLENGLRTTIASRIAQGIGRLTRGTSDHAIIFILGNNLHRWLMSNKNLAALPPVIQKQFSLGKDLSASIEDPSDLNILVDSILVRDSGWVDKYEEYMSETETVELKSDFSKETIIALRSHECATYLWHNEFELAIKCLESVLNEAFEISMYTGAWYQYWIGMIYHLAGDFQTAKACYYNATKNHRGLPAQVLKSSSAQVSEQASNISSLFKSHETGRLDLDNKIRKSIDSITLNGVPKVVEEEVRQLGEFLGLKSTRPDAEFESGPDVLWELRGVFLCFELKTDKTVSSTYNKRDIGQMLDHIQWVEDHYNNIEKIIPVFVGPKIEASHNSNPPDNMLKTEVGSFGDLKDLVQALLSDAAVKAVPNTLENVLDELLTSRNLKWPDLLSHLDLDRLKK